MSSQETLSKLSIPADRKRGRKRGPAVMIAVVALLLVVGLVLFARSGHAERKPVPSPHAAAGTDTNAPPVDPNVVLTVSGYVIPRERIEISPRFQGTVKWIGVKKGDQVKQGEVLVRLEDDEQQARVQEAQGRVLMAQANLRNAELQLTRLTFLASNSVESASAFDEALRARDAASAEVLSAEGQVAVARTYLDWCTIRAPISGTILEKLVNPNELVSPQSFGGTRGPSTAFLAMADLQDLQVEIDLNESDTPKVALKQKCRISPEAYQDKQYEGYVAEIAPEANRAKGTLQVKVQVQGPDAFLTPELTAKVDFLKE